MGVFSVSNKVDMNNLGRSRRPSCVVNTHMQLSHFQISVIQTFVDLDRWSVVYETRARSVTSLPPPPKKREDDLLYLTMCAVLCVTKCAGNHFQSRQQSLTADLLPASQESNLQSLPTRIQPENLWDCGNSYRHLGTEFPCPLHTSRVCEICCNPYRHKQKCEALKDWTCVQCEFQKEFLFCLFQLKSKLFWPMNIYAAIMLISAVFWFMVLYKFRSILSNISQLTASIWWWYIAYTGW